MAVTTKQVSLGFDAPDFKLLNTISGNAEQLHHLMSGKASVLMFICNHCPYVKHVIEHLVELANDYIPKGISFIAVCSNDPVSYPEDAPDKMKEEAVRLGFPFPYLFDETQEVARAYHAECTPDFNIFNGERKCIYRGQLDDSRPGNNIPVSGSDIRAALDAVLQNREPSPRQKPSVGCSIKWKK